MISQNSYRPRIAQVMGGPCALGEDEIKYETLVHVTDGSKLPLETDYTRTLAQQRAYTEDRAPILKKVSESRSYCPLPRDSDTPTSLSSHYGTMAPLHTNSPHERTIVRPHVSFVKYETIIHPSHVKQTHTQTRFTALLQDTKKPTPLVGTRNYTTNEDGKTSFRPIALTPTDENVVLLSNQTKRTKSFCPVNMQGDTQHGIESHYRPHKACTDSKEAAKPAFREPVSTLPHISERFIQNK
jgi:hypothetical protein